MKRNAVRILFIAAALCSIVFSFTSCEGISNTVDKLSELPVFEKLLVKDIEKYPEEERAQEILSRGLHIHL